jgi:phosphocarrier protein HPr
MVAFQVTVETEGGLHARPASILVNKANQYRAAVKISKGDNTAEAKSILNLMKLSVKKGDVLNVVVEGEDEKEAAEAIKQLFAANFAV